MKSLKKRTKEAKNYHDSCLEKLDKSFNPKQKFQIGDKVKVAKDLGPMMSHFKSDFIGTVEYTYGQMFGGDNFDSYSLIDENGNSVAWYEEHQLTLVKDKK